MLSFFSPFTHKTDYFFPELFKSNLQTSWIFTHKYFTCVFPKNKEIGLHNQEIRNEKIIKIRKFNINSILYLMYRSYLYLTNCPNNVLYINLFSGLESNSGSCSTFIYFSCFFSLFWSRGLSQPFWCFITLLFYRPLIL